MKNISLAIRKSGARIGNLKLYFLVNNIGEFSDPEDAYKNAKRFLKTINVVLAGRAFYSNPKIKEIAYIKIKRYSFLKMHEFARDFGIKNFRWR